MPSPVMPVGGPVMPSGADAEPCRRCRRRSCRRSRCPIAAARRPAPVNPAKMQAMQCIAEGKDHQAAGRYMEARVKYQEAQRCGGRIRPDRRVAGSVPDGPVLRRGRKQIDAALKDASPTAEAKLNQARALAVGFALDTRAIDAQLAAMKGAAAAAARRSPTMRSRSAADLLDKARLELHRGQCETARQLATEVHNGPYGLQAEAVVAPPDDRRRGVQPAGVDGQSQLRRRSGRLSWQGVSARRWPSCNRSIRPCSRRKRRRNLKEIMDDCSRHGRRPGRPRRSAAPAGRQRPAGGRPARQPGRRRDHRRVARASPASRARCRR